MGGKKKPKTKWRKLSIGAEPSDEDSAAGSEAGIHSANGHRRGASCSEPQRQNGHAFGRECNSAERVVKGPTARMAGWVAVPLVPLLPPEAAYAVPPQCYAENGPDTQDGETKGCYVNGLWIPNSELRRYRNSAPPPPPVGPSIIPPVRARPDGTPDPFVPSNQHYYLYFILPKPPYQATPPQQPAAENCEETATATDAPIPKPEPNTSPYWTSMHTVPRPAPETQATPATSSDGEQQESGSPPSASPEAASYTYPGYTFGPSLYGTVTGAYPVPLVLGPPLGPVTYGSPQLLPRSRYYRATGRRKPAKSFADFGMDNGQERDVSQEPPVQPTEATPPVTSHPTPESPTDDGLPPTPPSDLSEEDLTDSTARTIEAKLQTSSSSGTEDSSFPTVRSVHKDVNDLATRTVTSSMNDAQPEIRSVLSRKCEGERMSVICYEGFAGLFLEKILSDVRTELQRILKIQAESQRKSTGEDVTGKANKLASQILSAAVSASARSLLEITRKEEEKVRENKSKKADAHRERSQRKADRQDSPQTSSSQRDGPSPRKNFMTNIRDKAHFLGVTATSPETVLQGMLGAEDASEPPLEEPPVRYGSQTEALLRDTEAELLKLDRLTHNSDLGIYRLAFYDESDGSTSPVAEMKEDSLADSIQSNCPVGRTALVPDQSDDGEADTQEQMPFALKDMKRRSEIVVHVVDDISEAGSEDVELLPHRYDVSEGRKHVYVNKLSLATELLQTGRQFPSASRPRDVAEDSGVQSEESADEADVLDGAIYSRQPSTRSKNRSKFPLFSAFNEESDVPFRICCSVM